MTSSLLKKTIEKASQGIRLGPNQALLLYEKADLLTLGRLAGTARFRHNPGLMPT
ncbi:MAG: dehypoxanthine futalosine cyclase, partial [Deltaproteobacteria bacterium]|nr:dehypoxanthine futalosine cyclase [Deltaproteobacteria bacterium]